MFGRGKQQHQQPGKIRLPKQSVFPDLAMLKSVYEQAQVNRPQEVELMWSVPGTYKTYCLLIKFDKVTPHPLWNLWEDDGRQSKLVSKFETSDLNLIMDVMMMLETQSGAATGASGTGNYQPVNLGSSVPPRNNPAAGQSTFPPANKELQFGGPAFSSSGGYPAYQQQPDQRLGYGNQQSNAAQQPLKQTGGYQAVPGPGGQMPGSNTRMPQAQQQLGTTGNNRIVPMPPMQQPDYFRGTPVFGGGGGPEETLPGPQALGASMMPQGSLPPDFYSETPAVPGSMTKTASTALEGNLRKVKMSEVLTNIGMNKVTGMLEVISDAAIAQIYIVDGTPKHAQAGASRGDAAIKEVVTWRKGDYKFHPKKLTDMTSCEKTLQASIMEGTALLEQLRHLEAAGLVYESQLVLKQKISATLNSSSCCPKAIHLTLIGRSRFMKCSRRSGPSPISCATAQWIWRSGRLCSSTFSIAVFSTSKSQRRHAAER
ncbi:MAG: DUF4388 domain-containing protein [Candidatus Obscuribacterales bacterium]|nr:DUF4388 domain-containing protein [Candidatus Obscuribacterales bacterium]